MNKFLGIGRLTRDPELKYTNNQKEYCRFGIAINRRFKREGQAEADFFNCIAWGKTAELISKYFHKGKQIALEGRFETGSYDNADGNKVYTTDLIVEQVMFVGNKEEGQAQTTQVQSNVENEGGFYPTTDNPEDDLPF